MYEIEQEIDVLESTLSDLESAIGEIKDSPYHSYLATAWEVDLEEIQDRLNELYDIQNDCWKKEMEQQNHEYEMACLGGIL